MASALFPLDSIENLSCLATIEMGTGRWRFNIIIHTAASRLGWQWQARHDEYAGIDIVNLIPFLENKI